MNIFLLLSVLLIALSSFFLLRGISSKKIKLITTALFFVTTGLLYQFIGTPKAITSINNKATTHINSESTQGSNKNNLDLTQEQIKNAITALKSQLKENPNDIEKLTLLANTYAIDQRFLDSASIWQTISEKSNKPEHILKQVNMLIAANKGTIPDSANTLINGVLAKEASTPQALWLAGLYAAQNNNNSQAINYWNKLRPLVEEAQQSELNELISQLASEKIAPQTNTYAKSKKKAPQSINVNVSLSSSVKNQVSEKDTVFVFAKALDGPPTPLAVKRLTVSDLPIKITLSDADSMLPSLTINQFEEVKISAKISTSGNAANKMNDISSIELYIKQPYSDKQHSLVIGVDQPSN